ncbi:MAG: molecular chaperone HtpG [Myxococcales bacterium]|nr:molecular chaperone HtpG [Myxococcales bacterium]
MADTLPFQAEVKQLLDLVVHSLYSDREIFLRELISNASDALDRARFLELSRTDLRPAEGEPAVRIWADKDRGTITIQDVGIGLTRDEAVEHLGTIAKSGTKAFAAALKEKGTNPEGLIGQFGVGFYSSFMVAHRVVVDSLSAEPGAEPIRWTSEGGGEFNIEPGDRATRGTDVVLHVRSDCTEFLDDERLREVVEKHSDFLQYPVFVGKDGPDAAAERVNQTQALWTRNPREVSDDEYKGFYKHVAKDWQDPLSWVHITTEAPLEFQSLLFFPQRRPFDLDHPEVKRGLRLYQRRVMVLDAADQFLPRYLRFVRGLVDAPEVQLNVSREILQNTPVIGAIKKQLVKRVLRRLKELSREDETAWLTFWENFGLTLKEGVAEDTENKEQLTPLLRFRSTAESAADAADAAAAAADGDGDGEKPTPPGKWRSLADYKIAMKDGQDTIWYLTGLDLGRMRANPQLERFKKKGWEVLLLSDPVDEWVVMNLNEFEGVPLKSAARGDFDDKTEDPVADEARKRAEPFLSWLGAELAGQVGGVRASNRLTDSPAVLVDAEWGVSANMERILRSARQDAPKAQRTLEINPEHALVRQLVGLHAGGLDDASKLEAARPLGRLLLDYAQLAEGHVEDAPGFAGRLAALMSRSIGA